MFAVTMDQQGSRQRGDLVEAFLAHLDDVCPPSAPGVVRAFERTVGDEVQGLLDDSTVVVDLVLGVLRLGGWSIGVGAGPVEEPVPASVRAAQGEALVLAREAVEAAKSRSRAVPLAVRGVAPAAAAQAEGVLVMLGALAARRSPAGWAAIDAVTAAERAPQGAVAESLGISQQAVSQRLRTALWAEETAVRPAAATLLAEAATPVGPGR